MDGTNRVELSIRDIDQLVKSKTFKVRMSKSLINRIRRRTRLGKGVKEARSGFSKAHDLPRLKKQTVARRKRLKRAGGLTGPGATPGKSGLNRSGKLLNNMHYKIKREYLLLSLDKRGKVIADDLIEKNPDWEFFNLSQAEFNFLRSEIQREVNKLLKRRLG